MENLKDPDRFGSELLKALGLFDKGITSFTLRIEARKLPVITVEYVSDDLLQKTFDYAQSSFSKQFHIVENDD